MIKKEIPQKLNIDPTLLKSSEIRDGEFIRYYGKESELTIPDFVTGIATAVYMTCYHNFISCVAPAEYRTVHGYTAFTLYKFGVTNDLKGEFINKPVSYLQYLFTLTHHAPYHGVVGPWQGGTMVIMRFGFDLA